MTAEAFRRRRFEWAVRMACMAAERWVLLPVVKFFEAVVVALFIIHLLL